MRRDILAALEWRRKHPTGSAVELKDVLSEGPKDRLLRWFLGHPYGASPEATADALDALAWCEKNSTQLAHPKSGNREALQALEEGSHRFGRTPAEITDLYDSSAAAFSETNQRPFIIAIEGIDGSGKTTQVELLLNTLRKTGATATSYSFPLYESFFGREIGALLAGKDERHSAQTVDPKSMALWYALDRMSALSHARLIGRALPPLPEYVVMNRYTLSSAVYQSARALLSNRATLSQWIFDLEHRHLGIPVPDLYLVLDVPVATSTTGVLQKGQRQYTDEGADIYEANTTLLGAARRLYLEFAEESHSAKVIYCGTADGKMKPAQAIHEQIFGGIQDVANTVHREQE